MSEEKKEAGTKVKAQIAPAKKVPKEKVFIMFRQQRKYDLHVGREMIVFRGRETKTVPVEWLDHPDFKQVAKLFIVRG